MEFQCINTRYALSNRHFCDMLRNYQLEIKENTSELLVNFKTVVCCKHVTADREKQNEDVAKRKGRVVLLLSACS